MLIKFSAYSAYQLSVIFSFSSVISFKMRINTEESVLVGGSEVAWFLVATGEGQRGQTVGRGGAQEAGGESHREGPGNVPAISAHEKTLF